MAIMLKVLAGVIFCAGMSRGPTGTRSSTRSRSSPRAKPSWGPKTDADVDSIRPHRVTLRRGRLGRGGLALEPGFGCNEAIRSASRRPCGGAVHRARAPNRRPNSTSSRRSSRTAAYSTASPFTGPIRDPGSLQELREAVRGRGRRGIAALRAKYDELRLDSPPTREQIVERLQLEQSIGFLYMYEGKFLEAAAWIEQALSRPSSGDARRDPVPA